MATPWLLIWLMVLWLASMGVSHFPALVGATGVDIQGAVQRAAKAAVLAGITPESYAAADPRIDPNAALAAARRSLAENLRLDPATLQPREGSWFVDAPQVSLAIANGPFPQTLEVPGHSDVRVTFPTAGVLLFVDGAIWTPGRPQNPVSAWAAARVYGGIP
jgi:hypothetical protein